MSPAFMRNTNRRFLSDLAFSNDITGRNNINWKIYCHIVGSCLSLCHRHTSISNTYILQKQQSYTYNYTADFICQHLCTKYYYLVLISFRVLVYLYNNYLKQLKKAEINIMNIIDNIMQENVQGLQPMKIFSTDYFSDSIQLLIYVVNLRSEVTSLLSNRNY